MSASGCWALAISHSSFAFFDDLFYVKSCFATVTGIVCKHVDDYDVCRTLFVIGVIALIDTGIGIVYLIHGEGLSAACRTDALDGNYAEIGIEPLGYHIGICLRSIMICWSAAPFFVIDYIRQIAKACGQGIAYKLDIEILFGGRIDELTVYADTDNINIAVVSFGLTDYSEAVFTLFKLLCKDELVNAVGSDLKACFTALAVNISGVININFTALHGGFGKDTDLDFSFAVGIEFKYTRRAQHCKPFFVHNSTSLSFVKTVHLGNIVISSDRVLGSICRHDR